MKYRNTFTLPGIFYANIVFVCLYVCLNIRVAVYLQTSSKILELTVDAFLFSVLAISCVMGMSRTFSSFLLLFFLFIVRLNVTASNAVEKLEPFSGPGSPFMTYFSLKSFCTTFSNSVRLRVVHFKYVSIYSEIFCVESSLHRQESNSFDSRIAGDVISSFIRFRLCVAGNLLTSKCIFFNNAEPNNVCF